MQDKDKLFLVVYFGVKNRAFDIRTQQTMIGFYEQLKKTMDDSVKVYVVPQPTTDEVKFELLNIENVSEERLNEIENIYQQVLNAFKKDRKEV